MEYLYETVEYNGSFLGLLITSQTTILLTYITFIENLFTYCWQQWIKTISRIYRQLYPLVKFMKNNVICLKKVTILTQSSKLVLVKKFNLGYFKKKSAFMFL